jgi:RNA 2',3'-cyclic 3'-phosphodiesterase
MSARLKLFIGLDPPWSLVSGLEWTKQDLKDRGLPDLDWIERERLHMTLVPLGRVHPQHIPQIIAVMQQAAADCEPFQLQAGAIDVFGQRRKPTVVWSGVHGEMDQLNRLRQALHLHIRTLGLTPAHYQFNPHITLAYVPRGLRSGIADYLRGVVARTGLPASDPDLVRGISLVHSTKESGHLCHKHIARAVIGLDENGCSANRAWAAGIARNH